MSSVEVRAPYKSAGVALSGASKTNILTCPTDFIYVITGLNICASAGAAGTADVIRYDGTTEYYLRYQSVVPAAGSLDIEFRPIVLLAGHVLRVRGAAAQHVDVSYMEYPKVMPTAVQIG